MSRLRKHPDDRQTHGVLVRFTEGEYATVNRLARGKNRTVAGYVRDLAIRINEPVDLGSRYRTSETREDGQCGHEFHVLKAKHDAVLVGLGIPWSSNVSPIDYAYMLRAVSRSVVAFLSDRTRIESNVVICTECGKEITGPHHTNCPLRDVWRAIDDIGLGADVATLSRKREARVREGNAA